MLEDRARPDVCPVFAKWRHLYEAPETGGEKVTYRVLFHSLAGDWSDFEERLRLAEKDDQDRREGKETPLDCLYWSLCWYCYFRMLERRGTGTVWMKLGEDGSREWTCLEAAAYFEEQADCWGHR